MKKMWLNRAVGIGISLIAAVGLAACGKGGDKNENLALAKEHVYKFQEFELPEVDGDDYAIRGTFRVNDTIRLMLQVYHWTENSSNDMDIRMISMKEDGSDIQLTALDIPEWKSQAGQNDGSAETGSEEQTEEEGVETEDGGEASDAETDSASDAAVDTRLPIASDNFYENSYYGEFKFGSDGSIYSIRNYYYEDYSGEEYVSVQKNYLNCWNSDGSFAWEKELEGLSSEEEYIYVSAMAIAEDNTINLILTGDGAYKMTVDAQGNVSERTELSEDVSKVFSNVNSIMSREDGSLLVIYYDESDWQKQYFVTYDPVADTLGEIGQMPASMVWNGYNTMTVGKSTDFMFSNDRGVFSYKSGDADVVEKMNFINSDMNISNFNSLMELSDTSFMGVFYENYGNDLKAGIFTYVDPKDIPDKSVLVLAGNYIGSDIKQRVVEYNRSSEKYRITVKEYDSYNSYEDSQAGYTQLNNDITTGRMPDILLADGLPTENYIAKGLLADIGKMIEEDEELSQVEFVQNVFDAYSVEGKLYHVIPNFSVSTVVGKTSVLGDRTSWTIADMKQMIETLPEGTTMFGEMTRENFISAMMDYCGADFVDIKSRKCDFESQNFIDMLEYAKSLPESLDEETYGEDYWMNYESQYRENRTILKNLYVNSLSSVNYNINGSFGEEVTYIGFPTESGMGAYVQANQSYAISARSAYAEGAWEFLRYYLTEEFQKELGWGLPIQMKYFKEKAQEATQRPYYLNEDGEKEEYDDYYYINGEEIKLEPMTQAQVDKLVNYIFSINKCYYGNTEIMNIINEEAASYFSGQKTVQEAAKIIQSRAQIYVNE